MFWKNILVIIIVLFGYEQTAHAQSPPTDLTEMDIEEILKLYIIRREKTSHWSIGYRYIQAKFDGNRSGTKDLSVEEVQFRPGTEPRTTDNFPIVPLTIHQKVHILDITLHATEKWSIGLLLPYIQQETFHVSSVIREISGVVYDFSTFTIESSGPGDIFVSISRSIWHKGSHHILSTVGFTLPIGSIDKIGPTPRIPGQDTQLPFTMQIGSGTYDLVPGLTYAGRNKSLGWGGQIRHVNRLNKNSRTYSLGNRLSLAGWLKAKPWLWLEPSLTVTAQSWGRIDGEDEELKIPTLPVSPFPAAVTDPSKFGGKKVNVLFGATLGWPKGFAKGHTLNVEVGFPTYQSLNGPQPKEVWRFGAGWNWNF
ncbi:MAG: hypothetical protein ACI8V2_000515 [Candidatus Latescibacterota bacterium]|jgi:hypothetical protein